MRMPRLGTRLGRQDQMGSQPSSSRVSRSVSRRCAVRTLMAFMSRGEFDAEVGVPRLLELY